MFKNTYSFINGHPTEFHEFRALYCRRVYINVFFAPVSIKQFSECARCETFGWFFINPNNNNELFINKLFISLIHSEV